MVWGQKRTGLPHFHGCRLFLGWFVGAASAADLQQYLFNTHTSPFLDHYFVHGVESWQSPKRIRSVRFRPLVPMYCDVR